MPASLPDAVRAYLASKPRGSKGRHRYSPEDFGLTAGDIRSAFGDYFERFSIRPEH